jgi:acyl-CoA-binding protein
MEALNGPNSAERPMWAEKGGIDFEGRAKWDAWTAVKGMKPDKARLEFVRVRASFLPPASPAAA